MNYTIVIPELGSNPSFGGLAGYADISDVSNISDISFTLNLANDISNISDISFNLSYNISHDLSDNLTYDSLYNISQDMSFNISTAEYLSGLTEQQLKEALGYIADYNIFFDKDYFLNGDTLTYSADHSSDGGNTWTELNITGGKINFTTETGGNMIRISVSDLEGNESSIYVKYN